MRISQKQYDVCIIGAGIAGLTLALELKNGNPLLQIILLEKREGSAAISTHKVGESLSELGASYLCDKLKLEEYLEHTQQKKFGLRFFFSSPEVTDISNLIEVGTFIPNDTKVFNAYQLDRGALENDLIQLLKDKDVEIKLGATVKEITVDQPKTIQYRQNNEVYEVYSNWLIDGTGRRNLIGRKLQLQKSLPIQNQAVWFRLAVDVDIQDWSKNTVWKAQYPPLHRKLATNHIMLKGAWIWIISLKSGNTSIGIVSDPKQHAWDDLNTEEKSWKWLEQNASLVYNALSPQKDKVLDFKAMKSLAFSHEQFISEQKWALIGDAALFIDPLYSSGIDFIALSNGWISDLIISESKGEDIRLKELIYERVQMELFKGWQSLYQNLYEYINHPQIMLLKICWDWATYWSIPCQMFINDGYTKVEVLKFYAASKNKIGARFEKINSQIQQLFSDWNQKDNIKKFEPKEFNLFKIPFLLQLQLELSNSLTTSELKTRLVDNIALLEGLAAIIFSIAFQAEGKNTENRNIDPYQSQLDLEQVIIDELSSSEQAIAIDHKLYEDMSYLLFPNYKPKEYANS